MHSEKDEESLRENKNIPLLHYGTFLLVPLHCSMMDDKEINVWRRIRYWEPLDLALSHQTHLMSAG